MEPKGANDVRKSPANTGTDLRRIHRVITRGLAVAQQNCQTFIDTGFPDHTTREGFWKYCLGLEANTNGHHKTEDDLFFPFIEERMPETDFDELRADHREMDEILAEMRAAREGGSLAELSRGLFE